MLLPDCGCCEACCLPEFVEVQVGGETNLGVLGMIDDGSSPGIWSPGNLIFLSNNLAGSSADGFGLPITYTNTNTEAGPLFACTSPSDASGKCMRLSPSRLQAFSSAVAGTYQLAKNPNCMSFSYVNNGDCSENIIRRINLYFSPASEDYSALLPSEFVEKTSGGALKCQTKFVTYPAAGLSGWLEYRMSVDICIAGDRGNQVAGGCADSRVANADEDMSRCSCYPTTASTQASYSSTGQLVQPAQSGPCSYSGTCYASLAMHSVGSFRNAMSSTFLRPFGNRATNNARAMWSQTSGSVANLSNPYVDNPSIYQRWCDVAGPIIYGSDITGNEETYNNAQCGRFTSDIYFALSTRSPLANYRFQSSANPDPLFDEYPLSYSEVHWDYFGIGVKLKKTLTP